MTGYFVIYEMQRLIFKENIWSVDLSLKEEHEFAKIFIKDCPHLL